MAQLKHTPGPWTHSDGNTYFNKLGKLHIADLILDANGQWLAAVWQGIEGGVERQEANARLIAAAPELLEALKQADFFLGRYGESQRTKEIVRAAITRATGGGQ